MKIGVIGDSFLDRYWVGHTRGLSAEAPIPVIDIDMKFDLPGGAANVRSNLISLGGDGVMLMHPLSRKQNYPIKNRLIVDNTQLARWDEMDWCEPFQTQDLLALIDCDAVVVADYGKGSVSEEVIQVLRQCQLPVFVDTKGDPTPWMGTEVVMFPNLKEYKTYESKYEWFGRVILKKGPEGISWVEYGRQIMNRPALSQNVVCVNGAGDTALAAFAIASLGGADMDYCLRWANAAAGFACSQPYTSSVLREEADAFLTD